MPTNAPDAQALPPERFEVHLPQMHRGQAYVMAAKKRRNIVCAHRGWPKSSLLTRIAIQHLLEGRQVGWYAPTSNHLLDNWNQHWSRALTKKVLESCLHRTDQKITLPGYETCWFYSMEIPSNSVGPTYPVLLLDEGGAWPDGAFDSAVEPIATKALATFGWYELWWVGTPNREGNPYNDYWHALQMGLTGEDPETVAHLIPAPARVDTDGSLVARPSPHANPAFTFEMLANSYRRARRKERWRIEYLCEFITDTGGQFENVAGCCTLPSVPVEAVEDGWYQTGVDVGIRRDYAVIDVIDLRTMNMVYHRRFLPGSWAILEDAILDIARRYPGTVRVDCTGLGDRLPETLLARGLAIVPVVWGIQNKAPALDHLAFLLDGNYLQLWDDPVIVFELQMMARESRPAGGWRIEAVKGAHDDVPMALALAVWGAQPVERVQAAPANLEALIENALQETRSGFFNDPLAFGGPRALS
jgi:hypothetical protein